jgi:hypothetical protein
LRVRIADGAAVDGEAEQPDPEGALNNPEAPSEADPAGADEAGKKECELSLATNRP